MTDEAILATLDRFNSASQRQDAEEALAVFAPDDDVMVIGSELGESAAGRPAVLAFLTRVMQRPGSYSWTWDVIRIFTRGKIAWVFCEGMVHAGPDRARTSAPYRATIVMEQINGEWRWRLFNGSEPVSG